MPGLRVIAGWYLVGSVAGVATAQAQTDRDPVTSLAIRLSSWTAVTGYEQAAVDTILKLLPRSVRDRAGSARFQQAGGSVKRLVACPLDEPGYVVGGIQDDGYLRLRRVGRPPFPLFDQQLEGHRVTIYGRTPRPGVVAVRSIHLTRGREPVSQAPFTVDDAYVDVGAVSRAQAGALGIRVLAPVTLTKRPHQYGNRLLAAPMVGRRVACAALLVAVQQSLLRAKALPGFTAGFVVEQGLSQRGLTTLAHTAGPFEETILLDGRAGRLGHLEEAAPDSTVPAAGLGKVHLWPLPVSYAGTAVETVSLDDADSLRSKLMKWIGADQ
jgi:hypothetical protein